MIPATELSPTRDATLENILCYLDAQLNAQQAGAIASLQVLEYSQVQNFAWPTDPNAYPVLAAYRISSKGQGLDLCKVALRYLLPGNSDRSNWPGNFRWIETGIVKALSLYRYSGNPLARIDESLESTVTSRYSFPWLEMQFEIVDEAPRVTH